MAQTEEPLLESAPLALRLAGELCRRDAATGEDCAPEHGTWQYLRLLGLVGSIESRAGFYGQALAGVSGTAGVPRILLSGTADYALLALLLRQSRGRKLGFTVVDLCETPLALNRWYAERSATALETTRSDILSYAPAASFDAVCTDAFFGRFPAAGRARLVAKWRDLLRPGGQVITTCRLRPPASEERLAFGPGQVAAFRDAVFRAATDRKDLAGIDPGELAARAERYAQRHFTWAVRSAEEIRALFERGGFSVSDLSTQAPPPEANLHGASGPSVRGNPNDVLRVIATRT